MTKLTFQTSEVLVEVYVYDYKNPREVRAAVADEYGVMPAFECMELYMAGDYFKEEEGDE